MGAHEGATSTSAGLVRGRGARVRPQRSHRAAATSAALGATAVAGGLRGDLHGDLARLRTVVAGGQ